MRRSRLPESSVKRKLKWIMPKYYYWGKYPSTIPGRNTTGGSSKTNTRRSLNDSQRRLLRVMTTFRVVEALAIVTFVVLFLHVVS